MALLARGPAFAGLVRVEMRRNKLLVELLIVLVLLLWLRRRAFVVVVHVTELDGGPSVALVAGSASAGGTRLDRADTSRVGSEQVRVVHRVLHVGKVLSVLVRVKVVRVGLRQRMVLRPRVL